MTDPSRPWSELVSQDDDALPILKGWIAQAPFPVTLLAAPEGAGARTLEALQVTTRSPLGAVAFHTGGLLVDGGWLRVLGAGCPALPRALDGWNTVGDGHRLERGLLVADDALGGFFGWMDATRTIHYRAPDDTGWEDLGVGYGDWLASVLTDRLQGFYASLRWPGWEAEVAALHPEQGLHLFPPLFTRGPPVAERSRRAVPVEELWALACQFEALDDLPDGATFKIEIGD